MKKTILGLSAALLIATSLFVYAQPKDAKATASNQAAACDPNADCICVPTPDGGYVCVPKSSATPVQLAAAVEKPSCTNTEDCVCE